MAKQLHDIKIMFLLVKELTKSLRLLQNETACCDGVTFTQFIILDFVVDKGTVGLSQIHKLLAVEKSTTTRLVNPLVERKLLKKITSIQDSRSIDLSVTPQGKEMHKKMWDCHSVCMRNMMDQIPEEKQEDVFNSLQLFIKTCANCCSSTCNT